MSVRLRLTAFGVGLIALFGAGWGIGRAVGPLDQPEPAPMDHSSMSVQAGDTVSGDAMVVPNR